MNYFTTAAKRLPSAGIIPEFHAAISDAKQASHNAFSGSSYCVLQMVPFHYGEGVFQISYHGGSLVCPWASHQLFDEMHGRGALLLLQIFHFCRNSMPPSVMPRKQATMSAPRPSAAPATACCRWYPSITVRGSSRLAITVVPWCAHGHLTNCLMKCMVETERRLRLISHHPLNARLTPRVVVPFRHRRALNERRGLPHRWSFPIHRGRPQVPIRRPEPTSSPTAAAGDKVFPMRRRRRSPPLPMRSFPSAAAAAVTAH
uniref:Uncharacterized protein n=1 Tax=Oryza rufipogon TaxID=4529 RepID=A0A0E0RGV3_ORYRU